MRIIDMIQVLYLSISICEYNMTKVDTQQYSIMYIHIKVIIILM